MPLLELIITEPLNFVLLSFAFAIIPLSLWGYIFYRKHPVDRRLAIIVTVGGMIAVLPIWLYQWLFERYEHLDIFGAIRSLDLDQKIIYLITFMAIGVIEEQFKHWVVSIAASRKKQWRGIADAIEFSIMAALGFAFVENIVYFIGILKFEGFRSLIIPFVFRSVFSTFAHIFFSGVYGYHFGIAKHSREWLIEEMNPQQHQKFMITRWLYRLFQVHFFNISARILAVGSYFWIAWVTITTLHLPIIRNTAETLSVKAGVSLLVFVLLVWLASLVHRFCRHVNQIKLDHIIAKEEIAEGLFLAMFFHAIFNFILWLEWTWLVPLYLFCGYLYLAYELKLRENLMDFESIEENLRLAKTKRSKSKKR